jgi:hypothetical protein
MDNFYQRQPFDHLKDKIYRHLIRDFINGAAMPEAKIAAVTWAGWASRARDAAALYFRSARLTVDRCNGLRCSLTKNVLPVGFHPGAFSQPCANRPHFLPPHGGYLLDGGRGRAERKRTTPFSQLGKLTLTDSPRPNSSVGLG